MTRYSTINVLRDQQYRWKRRCCVAQMRPMQDQIFLSFQERWEFKFWLRSLGVTQRFWMERKWCTKGSYEAAISSSEVAWIVPKDNSNNHNPSTILPVSHQPFYFSTRFSHDRQLLNAHSWAARDYVSERDEGRVREGQEDWKSLAQRVFVTFMCPLSLEEQSDDGLEFRSCGFDGWLWRVEVSWQEVEADWKGSFVVGCLLTHTKPKPALA